MNYTIRDLIMWRWCAATFVASLIFSIIVGIFHPWNWDLPYQSLWLVPPITPPWLIWPITNTMFVLIFVWNETNEIILHHFWDKTRWRSYFRAFFQASLVGAFSLTYNTHALVISSILISLAIALYFSSDFDSLKNRYRVNAYYDDDYDELPSVSSYSFGSMLVFFYTLIVLSGLANLNVGLSTKQALIIFLFTPLIYLVAILLLIAIILVLLGIVYLLAASRLNVWPMLKKVGQWTFYLATNIFVAIGLLITLLCLGISELWKGACRGTRWLLPAHQS